ncbi:unnamed protein product, partial [Coregonus sp. 'balchen']
ELKETEDQILFCLSSTEGNPVDDKELIRVLGASKVKSSDSGSSVTTTLQLDPFGFPKNRLLHVIPKCQSDSAEETERDIDATRLEYVPVAVRTQILFFCVLDLSNVDPIYQYPLEWFLGIFMSFIANFEMSADVMKFSKISAISLCQGQVHRDFRLWLTSMPSSKFPVSILQNGYKMTIEPPRGIKANLLKTSLSLNDDFITTCTRVWLLSLPYHTSLSPCSCLRLFHGNTIERRKFGPLGLNIPYELIDGDLCICISQLKMFLEEYQDVPYKLFSTPLFIHFSPVCSPVTYLSSLPVTLYTSLSSV